MEAPKWDLKALQSISERTEWANRAISVRHRLWGVLPALDVDFLLIEYNRSEARALIEYKSVFAQPQYPSHPSYIVLSKIGDAAKLPVFVVRFSPDFANWIVTSINSVAKRMFPNKQEFSEKQYVSWLYHLRGTQAPKEVLDNLNSAI